MRPEIVLDARAELGEGPSWDSKNAVLYWVDILRGLVHVFEPPRFRDTAVHASKYVSSSSRQFVVSPSLHKEVIDVCRKRGVVSCPGTLTITELP